MSLEQDLAETRALIEQLRDELARIAAPVPIRILATVKPRGIVLNGPVVVAFRKKSALSVKDAAAKLGVSGPLWSMWESGKRAVTAETLEAIAALFELDDSRALRADVLEELQAEAERHRQRRNAALAEAS